MPVFEPHEYQIDCAEFMLERPNSGSFLKGGEGKTSTTLMIAEALKKSGKFNGMLVVTTKMIMDLETWQNEIKKWGFDFTSVNLHGAKKDKLLKYDVDIYFINYEGLHWLYENIDHLKADILILDESSKAKSFRSNRFKILKKIRFKFNRVHLLTATPSSQSYEDLFSQIYLLDQGDRLGKYITAFRNEYFYPSGYMGYTYKLQEGAAQKIFDKIKDIIYVTDKDYLKRPEPIYNDVYIDFPKKIRKKYNELEKEYITEVDKGILTAVNAGVKRGKLKQFCNGSVYDEYRKIIHVHDEKLAAAFDIVDDLGGSPILIGYEYKHDLESLLYAFPGAPYYGTSIDGVKPSTDEKKRIERRWNAGKIPVLLGQISSVSHGLNLQKSGHNLMFYSHLDKLEDVIQFVWRIDRQGQKKQVIVHRLIMLDSVDEDVIESQNSKKTSQKALLNAMKKRIK